MTNTAPGRTYLGVVNGWHRWEDGIRLPMLHGFDDPDADNPQDDDTTDDDAADGDEDRDEPIPDPTSIKGPKRARAARQAGQYRVQRNNARKQPDAVRLELAFVKAAGGQFVDADAAWKLADQSLLSFDEKGNIIGADDAVEVLAEAQPFLLVPDDEVPAKKEPDPSPRPARRAAAASTASGRTRAATARRAWRRSTRRSEVVGASSRASA